MFEGVKQPHKQRNAQRREKRWRPPCVASHTSVVTVWYKGTHVQEQMCALTHRLVGIELTDCLQSLRQYAGKHTFEVLHFFSERLKKGWGSTINCPMTGIRGRKEREDKKHNKIPNTKQSVRKQLCRAFSGETLRDKRVNRTHSSFFLRCDYSRLPEKLKWREQMGLKFYVTPNTIHPYASWVLIKYIHGIKILSLSVNSFLDQLKCDAGVWWVIKVDKQTYI